MSDNPFLDTLDEPKTEPTAPASAGPNPFAATLADNGQNDVAASLSRASTLNPDAEAKVLQFSRENDVGTDFARTFETLPKNYYVSREDHPKLFQWLKNPDNAAVAHDDLDALGKMERSLSSLGPERETVHGLYSFRGLLSGIGRGATEAKYQLRSTEKQVTNDFVAATRALLGTSDPGARWLVDLMLHAEGMTGTYGIEARRSRYEKLSQAPVEESHFLAGYASGVGRMLPGLAANVAATIGGTAVGGFVGGTGGATAGRYAGPALVGFVQTAGPTADRLRRIRDENGQPLSEGTVRFGAYLMGGVGAALNSVTLGSLTKGLPGMQTEAAAVLESALTRPTMQAAIRSFLRHGTESTALMTGQALGQTAAQIAFEQSAGAKEGATTWGEAFDNALSALVHGGPVAFGLALPGFRADMGRAAAAERSVGAFERFNEAAKESKLAKRDPASVENLFDGGHFFVPLDRFNAQAEALPGIVEKLGIGKEYAEAQATGGDVAIPTGKFAAQVAGTPIGDALTMDIRTDPGAMTPREAMEFRKVVDSLPAEVKAASEGEPTEVYQNARSILVQGGMNPEQADLTARVYEAYLKATGKRPRNEDITGSVPRGTFPGLTKPSDESRWMREPPGAAMPGEPHEFLDYNDETGDAAAAIVLGTNPVGSMDEMYEGPNQKWFAVDPEGNQLNRNGVDTREEARRIAEAYVAGTLGTEREPHRIFTKAQYDADQATISESLKGINSFPGPALDPKVIAALVRSGLYHVETLTRAGVEFSRTAWEESIRPALEKAGVLHSDEAVEWLWNHPDIRKAVERTRTSEVEAQVQTDPPIFMEQPEGAATKAEWDAYQRSQRVADDEKRTIVHDEMAETIRRQASRFVTTESERIRSSLVLPPEYAASHFLRRGSMIGGEDVPDSLIQDGEPVKIDSAAITEIYGKDAQAVRRALGPRSVTKEGGVHPDEIAEQFGFQSGQEMIDSIIVERPSAGRIEERVNAAFVEQHGDILGNVPERAMDAVQRSETTERQMVIEGKMVARLKAQADAAASSEARAKAARDVALTDRLARGIEGAVEKTAKAQRDEALLRDPLMRADVMRAMRLDARRYFKDKAARDTNPDQYRRAEEKAARELRYALESKDYAAARQAQWNRMASHAMWVEAREATTQAEKDARRVGSFTDNRARARLGKAGGTYLEQMDRLLSRFDFHRVSRPAAGRRQSLADFITEQEKLGLDPVVSDRLRDEAFRKPWQDMTHGELADLRETVDNISHLSRLKTRLLTSAGERDLATLKKPLLALAEKLPKLAPRARSDAGATAKQRRTTFGRGLETSLLNMDSVLNDLDGDDPNGLWHQVIGLPLADADTKMRDYVIKVSRKLNEHFNKMSKSVRDGLDARVHIPEIGGSLTRREMLTIALNSGNESNMRRLVENAIPDVKAWGPDIVESILSRVTEPEFDFLQGVWDTLGSMWPDVESMYKRLTGLAPERVDVKGFTRFGKAYAGGYYPLIYDSAEVPTMFLTDSTTPLNPTGSARALPVNGHVNARVLKYDAPIQLDMGALQSHVVQVLQDLTHREALLSISRLLADKDVHRTLTDRLGPERLESLKHDIAYTATRRVPPTIEGDRFWSNAINGVKTRAMVQGIGFRVTTFISDLAGPVQALEHVGPIYQAQAFRDFYAHPVDSTTFVNENSGFMRHYIDTYDASVEEATRALSGDSSHTADVQRFAFAAMGVMRRGTAYPIWMATFRKALKDHTETEAVNIADASIIKVFGAGRPMDTAPVQRATGAFRLMNLFYSWNSAMFQNFYRLKRDTVSAVRERNIAAFPGLLARSFFVWAVPALAQDLLTRRTPSFDDDPKEWAEWFASHIVLYPISFIPGLRDFGRAAQQAVDKKSLAAAADAEFTPLGRMAKAILAVPVEAWKAHKPGHKSDAGKVALKAVRASGYLTGIPTDVPGRQAEYLWDVWNGREKPSSFWDFANDVLVAPDHKKKNTR